MSTELELYYFPQSYYSQKVYLALLEKKISFRERLVFIHLKEQNEDWFLRVNPTGLVPALKDGDDVIAESEEIIDYVDGKTDSGPRLAPDVSTPHGQRVDEIRKWLFDIPVEEVTYGTLLNAGVRTGEMKFPKMFLDLITRERYAKSLKASIAEFTARMEANPSLHDVFTKKIDRYHWKLDTVFDEQRVRVVLGELQNTFDKIEQELEKSRKEAGTDEVWMCGTSFAAADVVMATLFNRLELVGQDTAYYSASKRPLVLAYHDRLFNRPTVKQFLADCSMARSTRLIQLRLMKAFVKKTAKVVLVVGVAAAVVYGVKEYIARKQ